MMVIPLTSSKTSSSNSHKDVGRGEDLAQTQPVHIGADKLVIHNLVKRDPSAGFAEDVRKGLSAEPKRLLPKYFYDELGSLLFDAICLLPEYYLTRAEEEILARYSDEIIETLPGPKMLLE